MIFEQIAYLHIHVELSISSVEAQLEKYHELLRTHCGLEKAVLAYMMTYINSSHYIRKEVYGDKPEDLPETSMVKENARLWYKVAKLHIRDLEDMENNIASLRNSLPVVIGASTGKIPFQAQYAPTAGANLYNVDAFCDTQDHLLTLTMSGTHYSKLLRENTTSHSVDISQSYYNVSGVKPSPTTTTSQTTTKGLNWGRFGYSGAKDSKFVSQPLTMQTLDQMVFIHGRPKREILGGIALGVATAATAMGIYNRAQIIALQNELFEVKDNVGRLFEVVQIYGKNMLAIETGFNELRTTLFYQVMFNPTLFDTRLSRLENQLRSRISRVTHAIQAAMHQHFAIDYLNPKELQALYQRLEAKAREAGCDLLIKYHSDLFQVESSLLFDGKDGHILIHVPMAPRNTLLRLFRLHPFPLPMFDTHHLMLDVKNDMLGISSTDTKYNIQLSSADLASCHRINQVFMCDSFGVMSRRFNDTCLGALYMQRFSVVKDLCNFKVVPMREQVYQVKKGLFLVYAPEPRNADVVCRNTSHPETHSEIHLAKGTQQIKIAPGCQAFFAEHLATSDYSIRLDSEIVHFEWDWDPLEIFPAEEIQEMAETLKNLSALNLQKPDLAELRYVTKIKEAEHNSEFGFNKLDLGLSDLASRFLEASPRWEQDSQP